MNNIIKQLNNPLRRRILELLKEYKAMRASDLKKELGIATGTLYYHIDVLGDLIERDGKFFKISKKGLKALEITPLITVSKLKITSIFHDKRVYTFFSLSGILILIVYFHLAIKNNLTPLFFIILIHGRSSLQNMLFQFFILIALTYGFSFIFTRFITRDYLLAFPYLLFSLIFYPFYILFLMNISKILLSIPMSTFIILNSLFLSKIIGMKIEKSLIINLTIAYIALFYSLLL